MVVEYGAQIQRRSLATNPSLGRIMIIPLTIRHSLVVVRRAAAQSAKFSIVLLTLVGIGGCWTDHAIDPQAQLDGPEDGGFTPDLSGDLEDSGPIAKVDLSNKSALEDGAFGEELAESSQAVEDSTAPPETPPRNRYEEAETIEAPPVEPMPEPTNIVEQPPEEESESADDDLFFDDPPTTVATNEGDYLFERDAPETVKEQLAASSPHAQPPTDFSAPPETELPKPVDDTPAEQEQPASRYDDSESELEWGPSEPELADPAAPDQETPLDPIDPPPVAEAESEILPDDSAPIEASLPKETSDSGVMMLPWEIASDEPETSPTTEPDAAESETTPTLEVEEPEPAMVAKPETFAPVEAPRFDPTNTSLAAWQLGASLGAYYFHADAGQLAGGEQLATLAEALKVDPPSLGTPPSDPVERILGALDAAKTIGGQVAKNHDAAHAALVESAFKSQLIVELFEVKPHLVGSVADAIVRASERANLPQADWQSWREQIDSAIDRDDVAQLTADLHNRVGDQLDQPADPLSGSTGAGLLR